jgi:branched-chain amino acid transport system permease protein
MGPIILQGILYGAIIALMAVGFQLIFGILHVVNYAHGGILMWGAVATYLLVSQVHIPFFGAMVITVVVMGLLGWLFDRSIMRRFHGDLMGGAIVTLALMLFLLNAGWFVLGPRTRGIPTVVTGSWHVLGTTVTGEQLLAFAVSIVVLLVFVWFLKYVKLGKSIRAVQQDSEAALTLGINVKHVCAVTFGLATALAALAGSLMSATYSISPAMGTTPLIFAFIVVILGGLGSVPGAFIASFIIGFQEALTDAYVGPQWSMPISFGLAVLVLCLFPRGLMGRYE